MMSTGWEAGAAAVLRRRERRRRPLVKQWLRSVAQASPLYYSLIEVVRRLYKVLYEDRDLADKQVSALPRR